MLFNHDLGLIDTIQQLDLTSTPPAGGVVGQLQLLGTGGLVLTSGTTAQRPATPLNGTVRYNTDLTKVEFYQNGAWVSESGGTVTSVAVSGSTGISTSGGPITSSGTITLTLGTELQGLSALAANGVIARTTTGTYAARTITGTASDISVTNGDGVAGNPTIDLINAGTPVTAFFGRFTTDTKGRVTATAAATSGDITTALGYTPVNKAGDTMSGALNMGGFGITNMAAAVNGTDAVTKNQLDAATSGLSWKQSVKAGSTANVSLTSAPATLDGVTLVSGDRVLLKNQTAPAENGIYVFTVAGAALTRSTDMDVSAEFPNATVYVSQGSTLADTGWTQVNDSITVGTSAVSFVQFSGSGTYTAGQGLTLTGNTFALSSPVATTLGGTGLSSIGSANQVLGVNTAGTGLEYKTIAAGTAISVTPTAGTLTIANTGVTSIVAGTGVSVSGATGAVTINNTGVTSVNATTTSAGLTITGGPITTTGSLTFTLSNDLQSLAGFNTSTGMVAHTAAGTYTLRAITGTTNQISVTNGDGVAGNPTVAIAANAVLPGTGAVTVPVGTSGQQPAAAVGELRYNTTTNRLEWSTASAWANVGTGDGTVSSVALSLPSIFTVSGSPVTSSGTLSATLASQTANTVFAAPNGSAGAPTFRTLAYADLPIVLYKENASAPVANTTTGTNSIALGSAANATLTGQTAQANGRFATNGDAQGSTYVSRNSTSTATPTELFLDGTSARLVVPNNSVWTFDILISGRRTDATGGGAGYRITGVLRKDTTAASIAFIGTPSKQVLGETTATMDASVAVDTTNGSLNITVTGIAAQTFRWVAVTRTSEVTN